jgi:hypothetical protein
MGRAYSTTPKADNWEDQDVSGWIILRWILEKKDLGGGGC